MRNVKTKTLTAMVGTVVLLFGLLGCAVELQRRVPFAPTDDAPPIIALPIPGIHAPQTAGDASEEVGISREEDAQLTPSPPTHVTVRTTATAGVIVLTWIGTGDDRIVYYQVYRKIADDEAWQFIAKVEATEDNRGRYEFRNIATEQGIAYLYGVSSVDTYGNESPISESHALTSQ